MSVFIFFTDKALKTDSEATEYLRCNQIRSAPWVLNASSLVDSDEEWDVFLGEARKRLMERCFPNVTFGKMREGSLPGIGVFAFHSVARDPLSNIEEKFFCQILCRKDLKERLDENKPRPTFLYLFLSQNGLKGRVSKDYEVTNEIWEKFLKKEFKVKEKRTNIDDEDNDDVEDVDNDNDDADNDNDVCGAIGEGAPGTNPTGQDIVVKHRLSFRQPDSFYCDFCKEAKQIQKSNVLRLVARHIASRKHEHNKNNISQNRQISDFVSMSNLGAASTSSISSSSRKKRKIDSKIDLADVGVDRARAQTIVDYFRSTNARLDDINDNARPDDINDSGS